MKERKRVGSSLFLSFTQPSSSFLTSFGSLCPASLRWKWPTVPWCPPLADRDLPTGHPDLGLLHLGGGGGGGGEGVKGRDRGREG